MSAETKQIPADALREALEQALSEHFGARRRVENFRRRRSAYASSSAIENLVVVTDHGEQLQMVLKDLSPSSRLAAAKKIRPEFLYEPTREIETYRTLLQPELGTATCFGAVTRARSKTYWLFLERCVGRPLWEKGRLESWENAARWLARLHERFATAVKSKTQPRFAHLLRYDKKFFELWMGRAEKFLRKRRVDSARMARQFSRLANRYDRVVKQLADLPKTFIHGEFYPSNVLVSGKQRTICALDWELAAIGPGLMDLAALTSGDWEESSKAKMVSAYREELQDGRKPLSELMEGVELCQLHLCVQLLGWAEDWTPPEEHSQNWLRQAVRLADKHGL